MYEAYALNFRRQGSSNLRICERKRFLDTLPPYFLLLLSPLLLLLHSRFTKAFSGDWDVLRNASPETVSVAMSPSGKSFAVGASRHVRIFSALQPEKQFNLSKFFVTVFPFPLPH